MEEQATNRQWSKVVIAAVTVVAIYASCFYETEQHKRARCRAYLHHVRGLLEMYCLDHSTPPEQVTLEELVAEGYVDGPTVRTCPSGGTYTFDPNHPTIWTITVKDPHAIEGEYGGGRIKKTVQGTFVCSLHGGPSPSYSGG